MSTERPEGVEVSTFDPTTSSRMTFSSASANARRSMTARTRSRSRTSTSCGPPATCRSSCRPTAAARGSGSPRRRSCSSASRGRLRRRRWPSTCISSGRAWRRSSPTAAFPAWSSCRTARVAGEVFAFGISEGGNDLVLFGSDTAAVPDGHGGYAFTGTKIFTSLAPVWTSLGLHGLDTTSPDAPKAGVRVRRADGRG